VEPAASPAHGQPAPAGRWLPVAMAIVGFAIGWLSRHRGVFNDGIFFVQWLSDWPLQPGEQHVWIYPHLLYLPLARAAHAAFGLFCDLRIDDSLRLFSALCTAAGGYFLPRLLLALTGPAAATLLSFAALLAPSVWFYSGATEIHSLHFAAAVFALAMAVQPPGRGNYIKFHLGTFLVAATHLTGVLLFPALLILRERADGAGGRTDGRRLCRRAAAMVAVVAATAVAALGLHALFPAASVLIQYFRDIHPGEQGWFETLWIEAFLRSGALLFAAVFAAVVVSRTHPPIAVAAAITMILYGAFIGGTRVENAGGYNVGAIPLWVAVLACAGARLSTARFAIVCLALVIAQTAMGFRIVSDAVAWDRDRDAAEQYTKSAKPADTLILYIPPEAVDFDLSQLPNLTRLYIGPHVYNAALLDAANRAGVSYCDPAGAAALEQRILADAGRALRDHAKLYVARTVLEGAPRAARMQQLGNALKTNFALAGATLPGDLRELVMK
jgi:hypothetical protein